MSPAKSPGLNIKSPAKSPGRNSENKSPQKMTTKVETVRIELRKDCNGLGLSIVGGSDTPLVNLFNILFESLTSIIMNFLGWNYCS